MAQRVEMVLEPRKSPVQARSTASVDAILTATIQVLLNIGKERLTTTAVAARAGVAVGTLYQYFPNKSALLQAVLLRHMNHVAETVEAACSAQHGRPVEEMAEPLVTEFLRAKMQDVRASVAMYAVSNDVDGAMIAKQTGVRVLRAMVAMLRTAREPLADPLLAASMVQGAMAGVSRRLLESDDPEALLRPMRAELIVFVGGYLENCTGRSGLPL
ncbi:TetR/AcrR family transcriptional regulator [Granulicella arctica]|uniref:TetR/AcrR family transcriptional regulator n=1 Tax=Granulicella arctica TaxID=940613 RepID=UPI0021DFBFEE|nr:TetR family transcriptional regulator [Granulicella arctica]